jgi:hypothetical protein
VTGFVPGGWRGSLVLSRSAPGVTDGEYQLHRSSGPAPPNAYSARRVDLSIIAMKRTQIPGSVRVILVCASVSARIEDQGTAAPLARRQRRFSSHGLPGAFWCRLRMNLLRYPGTGIG